MSTLFGTCSITWMRMAKENVFLSGIVAAESMMLSEFLADSLARTGDQVRESTRKSASATNQFIGIVSNVDYQRFEVMKLAGHSDFETTHRFYLAVADDLLNRAREVTVKTLSKNLARTLFN